MTPSFAIGIDFGTTYCCVAVLRHHTQEAEVIQSDVGANTTPSFVAYNLAHDEDDEDSDEDEQDVFAGEAAKEAAYQNPESTIFDIKRLIGRSFYDPHVQKFKTLWPFHLVNISGLVGVKVGDEKLLPQVVATVLLSHLKKNTENYLGCPINTAVVTIPVYYNDMQKDLTLGACQDAGFTSIEFIAEPVAAAVAYGLQSSIQTHDQTNKTCLIFDLGGGTFDVTVFQFDSTSKQVTIIASGGDDRLGGEDFNDLLTEYCIQQFKKTHGIDLAAGKTAEDPQVRRKTASKLRRIRKECEKQKCFLTSIPNVVISLDGIHVDHQLVVPVTRETFENIIGTLLTKTITILDETVKQSGFAKEEIDDVILIGGSSRIPRVQAMVQDYFAGKRLHRSLDADEAVACGAAIHAHNIFKENGEPFSVVTLKEKVKSGSANTKNTNISVEGELQLISLLEIKGEESKLSEQPWRDIQLTNPANSRSQLFDPIPVEQLWQPWREIELSKPTMPTMSGSGSESYGGPFIIPKVNQVKQQPWRKIELSKFSKSSSQLHEPIPTHQLEQPWRNIELSNPFKSRGKSYGSSLSPQPQPQPQPIPRILSRPQKSENIGAKNGSSSFEADHDQLSKAYKYKTEPSPLSPLSISNKSKTPVDPYAGASKAYLQRRSASRVSYEDRDLKNKSSTAYTNSYLSAEIPDPDVMKYPAPQKGRAQLLHSIRHHQKERVRPNDESYLASASSVGSWECPHCTFLNSSYGQTCEICENSQDYYVDEVTMDRPTTAIDRARGGTIVSQWSAMINSVVRSSSGSNHAEGQKSEELPPSPAFAADKTLTECPHCTLLNPNYRVICDCCQKRLKE